MKLCILCSNKILLIICCTKCTSIYNIYRYGENAGVATEDALATAGHCAGTAWNILKMRRAMTPAAAASSGALRGTGKTIKF